MVGAGRQTDRQTDRPTDRQTGTDRDRQTDRETQNAPVHDVTTHATTEHAPGALAQHTSQSPGHFTLLSRWRFVSSGSL